MNRASEVAVIDYVMTGDEEELLRLERRIAERLAALREDAHAPRDPFAFAREIALRETR